MNEEPIVLEDEDEYLDRIIKEFMEIVKEFQKKKEFKNDSMVRLLEDIIIKLK